MQEGDATFYGPKVDFIIKDSLGRDWQASTIQLDFNLPERFELEYAAHDGTLKRPVMIHRAILGSFERFFGLLIEDFGGAFPLWLAPVQARVLPIGEDQLEYARLVGGQAARAGPARGGGREQREAGQEDPQRQDREGAVPDRRRRAEMEQGSITVESYFDGKLEDVKSTDALAAKMKDEIAKKVYRRRE